MSKNKTWMGRAIDELDRRELVAALDESLRLLRSVPSTSFFRPDVEVRESASGTVVGRTFKWAFIPADQLWSDEDRREVQSRLDDSQRGTVCRVRSCGSVPTGWTWKCHADCRSSRSSPSRSGSTRSGKRST